MQVYGETRPQHFKDYATQSASTSSFRVSRSIFKSSTRYLLQDFGNNNQDTFVPMKWFINMFMDLYNHFQHEKYLSKMSIARISVSFLVPTQTCHIMSNLIRSLIYLILCKNNTQISIRLSTMCHIFVCKHQPPHGKKGKCGYMYVINQRCDLHLPVQCGGRLFFIQTHHKP